MSKHQEIFNKFYQGKYSGGKLQWQASLGHTVLKANFRSGQDRRSSKCLCFTALCLVKFNSVDGVVRVATNIEDGELKNSAVPCLWSPDLGGGGLNIRSLLAEKILKNCQKIAKLESGSFLPVFGRFLCLGWSDWFPVFCIFSGTLRHKFRVPTRHTLKNFFGFLKGFQRF